MADIRLLRSCHKHPMQLVAAAGTPAHGFKRHPFLYSGTAIDILNSRNPVRVRSPPALKSRHRRVRAAEQTRSTLDAINNSTKWAVSTTVALVFLKYRNVECAWCILGSIVCSFLGKALKRALDQARPEAARKQGPGMPSSHATSLAFLSVYAAGSVMMHWEGCGGLGLGAAAAIIAAAVFLAWLRVACGFHTVGQVLVGVLLGSTVALTWLHASSCVLATLAGAQGGTAALYGASSCAVMAFLWKNVGEYWQERHQLTPGR